MDSLFGALLVFIMVVVLIVAFNPIKREANLFRLNPFGAVPAFLLLLVFVYGMHLQGWVHWQWPSVAIVLFGWSGYFFLMFCYSYDGMRYTWFNGLWRRSVDAQSVHLLVWRRDKHRIAKVRFECDGGTVNTRTDMPDAVQLLKRMVEEHHIETKSERLPWWSV